MSADGGNGVADGACGRHATLHRTIVQHVGFEVLSGALGYESLLQATVGLIAKVAHLVDVKVDRHVKERIKRRRLHAR